MKNNVFSEDYYALTGENASWKGVLKQLYKNRELRYIFYGRMSLEAKSKVCRMICKFLKRNYALKRGNEINFANIGKGLTISHGTGIVINVHAKLGDYVSLRNGITIGAELRGTRKGNPCIGNRVWIGSNAVIVGNINIGDDVLIAPCSYVNRDVPDHSIVMGNPAVIIPKENATCEYIKFYR